MVTTLWNADNKFAALYICTVTGNDCTMMKLYQ